MVNDEEFAAVSGYFPDGSPNLIYENQYGPVVIAREDFKRWVLTLAGSVVDGLYHADQIEGLDPAIRGQVVEAALRTILHFQLRGDFDEGVRRHLVGTRMTNVVNDYRTILNR